MKIRFHILSAHRQDCQGITFTAYILLLVLTSIILIQVYATLPQIHVSILQKTMYKYKVNYITGILIQLSHLPFSTTTNYNAQVTVSNGVLGSLLEFSENVQLSEIWATPYTAIQL